MRLHHMHSPNNSRPVHQFIVLWLILQLATLVACTDGGDANTVSKSGRIDNSGNINLSAIAITEKGDGPSETAKDRLEIKGLAPGNLIRPDGKPIEFYLVDAPQVDSAETKISVEGSEGTKYLTFDATEHFRWEQANSALTVSGQDLKDFYSKLPAYPVTLSLSYISPDREYSRLYEITIQRAPTK